MPTMWMVIEDYVLLMDQFELAARSGRLELLMPS